MAEIDRDLECCPKFNPEPWDGKMLEWKDKLFIKDKVFTFLYMPMNFGRVIVRMMDRVTRAGGKVRDWLCLSDHTSKWSMDLYLAVDKQIPGAENVVSSGTFFSKVYEGAYKETGAWCKDYEALVKAKGLNIKKWYMWYTTCPKCSQKYGKNYVVIVGKVEKRA